MGFINHLINGGAHIVGTNQNLPSQNGDVNHLLGVPGVDCCGRCGKLRSPGAMNTALVHEFGDL